MAPHQHADLSTRELLTAVVNNLHRRFFEAPRLDAKQLFIAIQGGREIPFMEIRLPEIDDSLHCLLALDDTQYVGSLNFSRFRLALRAHMARIASALEDPDAQPNTFVNASRDSTLFNLPGITEHDGQLNVLMTGLVQHRPGQVVLRLVFLDPDILRGAD
ncbi:MAG: hypothetical protein GTN86_01085 [Xanthomonadales bacterium]|nr:hypothetical protein [Xanthomonadales bacterium]NIN58408.1 hypothetical protein [Xanthomonadales bacterium]NIN73745.1 hypothetical protein [Xanthomonadales bacterium]NIO14543.1 hypothetical protein [Xanthomonadales bacterium]NIP10801.1 hypothetical protein [Xanthomonadales bacterium]